MHVFNDKGSHSINDTIEILTTKFMITHHTFITYYPRGNGQVQSTNKTPKQLIIKLVNANVIYWDVMLLTSLWAYCTMVRNLSHQLHNPRINHYHS
jgi:hypothetical protein